MYRILRKATNIFTFSILKSKCIHLRVWQFAILKAVGVAKVLWAYMWLYGSCWVGKGVNLYPSLILSMLTNCFQVQNIQVLADPSLVCIFYFIFFILSPTIFQTKLAVIIFILSSITFQTFGVDWATSLVPADLTNQKGSALLSTRQSQWTLKCPILTFTHRTTGDSSQTKIME